MRISDWSSDVCSSDLQNTQQAGGDAPSFNLQRVYLKDLSLEMPNAPHVFLEQEQPQVEVSINVGGQRLAETVFESTVTATVTTRINDKVQIGRASCRERVCQYV